MKDASKNLMKIYLSSPTLAENASGDCTGGTVTREFHVSGKARKRYDFDESLFTLTGNVVFANFQAARVFAQKINARRDLIKHPESAARASEINAMGLIDEILHYVVDLYRQQKNPQVLAHAIEWLESHFSAAEIEKLLLRFVEEFPPSEVLKGTISPADYITGATGGIPNRQLVLEELIMLWLENANPAYSPYQELFDDSALEKETVYPYIGEALHAFFQTQLPFGPDDENLIDMLRRPAKESPHSLMGQLRFIRNRWGILLGGFLLRLLGSLDFLKEEEKLRLGIPPGGLGPGAIAVPEYTGLEEEPERFSADLFWMPRLVLIAKSTLVWLDQLSKKYERSITRLDQIPDPELDLLAKWGFTGLWLIGIWERSKASQKIKQMCGNPEAEASAYALYDYIIAQEIGGEEAYQNLRHRCWQRGIRLASDMVPNHTGIDGKWVMEHPDWFIQVPYSPFPSYTFNGPNLSENPGVGIYLEDHYYSRSDAAVVFKRVDFASGQERYIYHGNDGTSMPWNDTAQLNYLIPEVREQVIQTIIRVAKMFPIIRFDAAMVLTKKHFQRLWFPEPGTGGDIPSRAEFGMTREEFNRHMPQEFWREVVDRVAEEAPDTLLLAEAFWLMEGYFVRTLGMHRVYNSAFMNMLKNEENDKYRQLIKNTLEFNPEILKRYVNFMNNPDEETAAVQFGKGDKYFGVCMMLVTLPGLPMFGHGQIEGFAEKYGMEYRRAYWDEQPDQDLIRRHEREIFPLMKKRYLFADVQNFYLYDVFTPDGMVNENIFAYSNRFEGERALVVYNNAYESGSGWIRRSAAVLESASSGDKLLVQRTLLEGLGLRNEEHVFTIFRDHVSGLEFIRNNRELHHKGLFVQLNGYQYNVFLDFREVADDRTGQYARVAAYLAGRGVPSVDEVLREMFLRPVHMALESLLNEHMFFRFQSLQKKDEETELWEGFLEDTRHKIFQLLKSIKETAQVSTESEPLAGEIVHYMEAGLKLNRLKVHFPVSSSRKYSSALKYLSDRFVSASQSVNPVLFAWIVLHRLGKIWRVEKFENISRGWLDEWMFDRVIGNFFRSLNIPEENLTRFLELLRVLVSHQNWFAESEGLANPALHVVMNLLQDPEGAHLLGINRFQDVLWFNKEAFEDICWWMFAVSAMHLAADSAAPEASRFPEEINRRFSVVEKCLKAEQVSQYQVEKLVQALSSPKKPRRKKVQKS